MIKSCIPIVFLFVFSGAFTHQTFGQIGLRQDANNYLNAFIERDFALVVDYMHPNIVEMGGGDELILKDLANERQEITDQGMEYISFNLGDTGIVHEYNDELQVIIPVTFKVMIDKKEYDSETHILAISKKDSDVWTFTDLSKFDKASLVVFIKNLSPDLELK